MPKSCHVVDLKEKSELKLYKRSPRLSALLWSTSFGNNGSDPTRRFRHTYYTVVVSAIHPRVYILVSTKHYRVQ